ncbi:MAG: hypothetical protein CVU65_09325 [Deltaproteobacteria bacterium HGW-Deltaproteobacteria-22]|jgi:hypothetical protein|nr:MAG: hypothetical protein CVU65_09325 [Deltaproteobacteria bacterium HGW-Deltaproteobacteria-22]
MKKLLLICTLVFCTNCEEEKKEQKPVLTAEYCEAIHDEEVCRREGCQYITSQITFVDQDNKCRKKTAGGSICLYANKYGLNDGMDAGYGKVMPSGWTASILLRGSGFIEGWEFQSVVYESGGPDHCCLVDPDSCSEPWEDFTGQWFPFEGLLN